jgi:hypothetical protein
MFFSFLVDDHKTIREGLAALIGEQPDMEVVGQAGDGRKAVELAPGVAHRMREAGAEAYLLKSGPSESLLATILGRPAQG